MKNRQTRKAAWPALPQGILPGVPPDAPSAARGNRKGKTVIIITDEREVEEVIRLLLPGSGTLPQ